MVTPPAAREYASRYGCWYIDQFSPGREADVLLTTAATVVKFHHHAPPYRREVEVYRQLQREQTTIPGINIPTLIRTDDDCLAIEMTIVRPPFLLDFAAAKTELEYMRLDLDDDDRWAEHVEQVQERFDERWQDALHVADVFARATGWFLTDLHKGNIRFE